MNNTSKTTPSGTQQPTIAKYVQTIRTGIRSQSLTRHCIGFVLRGTKYIYYGDVRHAVTRGKVFYLDIGTHYIEDIPDNGRSYEEVILFYSSQQLANILNNLNLIYQLTITNDHSCPECEKQTHVIAPADSALRNFFSSVNAGLRENLYLDDSIANHLKLTELIYLVLSQGDCCLKNKVLSNMDLSKESFEQIVRQHIFSDISIEDLAAHCNMSLTSFKKEFRKHFYEPPHKWLIRQRLMHSRLLLISTSRSIAEIGIDCNFPNTSHFIKLFKKEYGMTPAAYRTHLISGGDPSMKQLQKKRSNRPHHWDNRSALIHTPFLYKFEPINSHLRQDININKTAGT